ncbi:L-seryl-tRNA(Sec) selenium transferase [Helicobacter sp. MIT 14-3879]|uniref:L-seryl-tRNA(Sec) selenium transferase n=1 Tax=Helicobacter sp. MIT 14-3879 TaxID=2040649 RepID=UPI000E1F97CB|nr:L-seryl-tRNA(Sec) selenium transferase [Helicobacter sp. MIT 14-3879]RDU63525.1 L-seryl-tRNA(Sec) selenium transferase [Helicobacter sp. MIT 14-3879]
MQQNFKKNMLLSKLPSIDSLLLQFNDYNKEIIKKIATNKLKKIRNQILDGDSNIIKKIDSNDFIYKLKQELHNEYIKATSYSLKTLINATGVVLQTNLGRSLIHKNIINEIIPILSHYSNLEYDLEQGKRGERYNHITNMLCVMFNVESALLVNNNAAAVFMILNTFAKSKEVIISRGELIEIGGSFRIPEIMESSGSILKEVGTTNKTHLNDYKNAINENSVMIMKAHKSNYEIIGFSKEVELKEIITLCKKYNLIDYYDLGSGYVKGLKCNEPSLEEISKNPPSLMSFSGDKLFGASQVGIILGKKELIDRLKDNHILRAFRVDKITIAILQATLKRYIDNNLDEILSIKMLTLSLEVLQKRAEFIINKISNFYNPQIINLDSLSGGGSLPNMKFSSIGISIFIDNIKINKLEILLRKRGIISRILNNKVVFDMRTLQDDEIEIIISILDDIKGEFV